MRYFVCSNKTTKAAALSGALVHTLYQSDLNLPTFDLARRILRWTIQIQSAVGTLQTNLNLPPTQKRRCPRCTYRSLQTLQVLSCTRAILGSCSFARVLKHMS